MKYTVNFRVKVRIPKEENLSGVSWIHQPKATYEANTIEELMEKAYAHPAPDDIDVEAIHLEGYVYLITDEQTGRRNPSTRKDIKLDAFREL